MFFVVCVLFCEVLWVSFWVEVLIVVVVGLLLLGFFCWFCFGEGGFGWVLVENKCPGC